MNNFQNKKAKKLRRFECREATIKQYVFGIVLEWIISESALRSEIEELLISNENLVSETSFKEIKYYVEMRKKETLIYNVMGYNSLQSWIKGIQLGYETEEEQIKILEKLQSWIVEKKENKIANEKLPRTRAKQLYSQMMYFDRMNKYIM